MRLLSGPHARRQERGLQPGIALLLDDRNQESKDAPSLTKKQQIRDESLEGARSPCHGAWSLPGTTKSQEAARFFTPDQGIASGFHGNSTW